MDKLEAFERETLRISLRDIMPLREVGTRTRNGRKYAQIANSIRHAGIIEPLVVARAAEGKFLLLDGRLRFEILKEEGAESVDCLIAHDDEAYTYNKRVCRLSIVQEHNMILRAISRGVPEGELADALSVSISTLRQKRNLLKGICEEVAALLKDKHVPINLFSVLRKMKPVRQVAAVQLMIAVDKFTVAYANGLLAASSSNDVVGSARGKGVKLLNPTQIALMTRESANLEREFRTAQQSFATRNLNLTIAKGFVDRLLSNGVIASHISLHHPDLLQQLREISRSVEAATSRRL